jgi:hypothetical protein
MIYILRVSERDNAKRAVFKVSVIVLSRAKRI